MMGGTCVDSFLSVDVCDKAYPVVAFLHRDIHFSCFLCQMFLLSDIHVCLEAFDGVFPWCGTRRSRLPGRSRNSFCTDQRLLIGSASLLKSTGERSFREQQTRLFVVYLSTLTGVPSHVAKRCTRRKCQFGMKRVWHTLNDATLLLDPVLS
jgi:hypothetical protein